MSDSRCWHCHVPYSPIYHHDGEICPNCGASPRYEDVEKEDVHRKEREKSEDAPPAAP